MAGEKQKPLFGNSVVIDGVENLRPDGKPKKQRKRGDSQSLEVRKGDENSKSIANVPRHRGETKDTDGDPWWLNY